MARATPAYANPAVEAAPRAFAAGDIATTERICKQVLATVPQDPRVSDAAVELTVLRPLWWRPKVLSTDDGRIAISRALAKTITFRTIATVMDFTMNFVVVGDLATAVVLSAFGFVLGPFVYLGHEAAWDHISLPNGERVGSSNADLAIAPARIQ